MGFWHFAPISCRESRVVVAVTKAITLAQLLTKLQNSPHYLGFSPTQWRWAFSVWLPLLPSLTFGEIYGVFSLSRYTQTIWRCWW